MFGGNTITKIQGYGQKGNAKKIIRYANSKKAHVRAAAAAALGCGRDDDSYNALITLLRDPEITVRINAAGALKEMGRASAAEHLRLAAKQSTDKTLIAACNDAAASLATGENS